MALINFTDGNVLSEAKLDSMFASGWSVMLKNHIRQLIDREGVYSADETDLWGEAYIDADGRNDSVDTTKTSAQFDTNKYQVSEENVYVIIEATNLDPSDFSINNCSCNLMSDGKWILTADTGSDDQKRFDIYATLFYGTNGTNGRATSTYITGLTALKTSVSADVGKKAFSIAGSWSPGNKSPRTSADVFKRYASFSDMTSNEVEMWYTVSSVNTSDFYPKCSAVMPVSTKIVEVEDNSADNFGGAGEIHTNPDGAGIGGRGRADDGSHSHSARMFALYSSGSITFTLNKLNATVYDESYGTNYTDVEYPVGLTALTEDLFGIITHDIPSGTFSSTVSSAIGGFISEDWEDGVDVQFKLTNATEDSGWLDTNTIETFTAFTAEPDTLIVKLIPKTTSPTAGYPSIKGFGVRAE